MAFETTINNTQKVRASVLLTLPDSTVVPVESLIVMVLDGDGTFTMLDPGGNPLPTNEVYLVSGSALGDTNYQFDIGHTGGAVTTAIVTLHVNAGEVTVTISFGAPEPK